MATLAILSSLKEMQKDLSRRYATHGQTLERYWRSFSAKQRFECFSYLVHADLDMVNDGPGPAKGHKYLPEVTPQVLCDGSPDTFLDLLRYRATTTLLDQYLRGPNGSDGDRENVRQILLPVSNQFFKALGGTKRYAYKGSSYTFFFDNEHYGETRETVGSTNELATYLEPLLDRGECVPEPYGFLILERQFYMSRLLLSIIPVILSCGSSTRHAPIVEGCNQDDSKRSLSSFLGFGADLPQTLSHILSLVELCQTRPEAWIHMILTRPGFFAVEVHDQCITQPGLVLDKRGAIIPIGADRHKSKSFFQAFHGTIQRVNIWRYIKRLVVLLSSMPNKDSRRDAVLSKLSTVSAFNFLYHQSRLRLVVQLNSGEEWFTRMRNTYDKTGRPVIIMKGSLEDIPEAQPYLRCLINLCRTKTNAVKAFELLRAWDALYRSDPKANDQLCKQERLALHEVCTSVVCYRTLHNLLPLPNPQLKKEDSFVGQFKKFEATINEFEDKVDLQDFVVPFDHLREPGVADTAREALKQFMNDNLGQPIHTAYTGLITDSIAALQVKDKRQHGPEPEPFDQGTEVAVKSGSAREAPEDTKPAQTVEQIPEAEKDDPLPNQRKKRTKTRKKPVQPAEQSHDSPNSQSAADAEPIGPRLKVSQSAKDVFETLFAKSRKAQGPVSWKEFEAAMAEAGFGVNHNSGSEYTFQPRPDTEGLRSLTVHRPHQAGKSRKIEGHKASAVARQLRKELGWDRDSFETK